MIRMLAFVLGTVVGMVGWVIGVKVGRMTAFALSVLGTAVGTYYAYRLVRDLRP